MLKRYRVTGLDAKARTTNLDYEPVVTLDYDTESGLRAAEARLAATLADLAVMAESRGTGAIVRLLVTDVDSGREHHWNP